MDINLTTIATVLDETLNSSGWYDNVDELVRQLIDDHGKDGAVEVLHQFNHSIQFVNLSLYTAANARPTLDKWIDEFSS